MLTHYLLVAIQFAGIAFFVVTGSNYPQNVVVLDRKSVV